MARLIDFDAAWSEHLARQPEARLPDIRMFGTTFPRKAQLPAAVALWAGRIQMAAEQAATGTGSEDSEDAGIELEDLVELLRLIVPTEVLDEWLFKQGRSEPELRRAFLALYAMYHGITPNDPDEGDDAAGEAESPASSKQSSKAGHSSKPTSKGSTARTSTG